MKNTPTRTREKYARDFRSLVRTQARISPHRLHNNTKNQFGRALVSFAHEAQNRRSRERKRSRLYSTRTDAKFDAYTFPAKKSYALPAGTRKIKPDGNISHCSG